MMSVVLSTVTVWMVLNTAIQKYLNTWLGNEEDGSGMPRFRLASGLFTQLFCLPLSLWLSVIPHGSFSTWMEDTEHPWDCLWPSVFSSVFGAFMFADLLSFRLTAVMVLHHITSLMSVFTCSLLYPEGFPYYALGIVILEIGSASLNIMLLGAWDLIYLVCMTLSNILGVVVFYLWMSSLTDWFGKIWGSFMFIPVIFMRQKAAYLRMLSAKAAPSWGRA